MFVCDKWVALKICEFLACVACVVTKRVSDDDSTRLALLQQKLSREWSLLRSVTWDALGSSFADAVYGGYVIITFGLILGRVAGEVPRGRRVLEGFLLGIGLLLFLTLGGLELASLDWIADNLTVNAGVLGAFTLLVAALFLIDLLGPRVVTTAHHSQTDPVVQAIGHNGIHTKGHLPGRDMVDGDTLKKSKDETVLFERPAHGYKKFADEVVAEAEQLPETRFGSYRKGGVPNGGVSDGEVRFDSGNYVRLSDPLADRLHYERELAKFNDSYLREHASRVHQDRLPELQTPVLTKVQSGRLRSIYDDLSPSYRHKSPKRTGPTTPTLRQLEDYLRGSKKERRARADTPVGGALSHLFPMEPIDETDDREGRARGTPTDPGYVAYAADRWSDPQARRLRTPRHSPEDRSPDASPA